jgi:hypothetical protein
MPLYNHKLSYRPLRGGVEIYNPVVDEVGTLGFIAQAREGGPGRWIVSCHHVLVGAPGRLPGGDEPVCQPAKASKPVATLDLARLNAALDCAAARVMDGVEAVGEILGVGRLGAPVEPAVGMRILKSGIATGVTEGVIGAVAGTDVVIGIPCGFDANYELSLAGDSGALWVERETRRPVALHRREIPGVEHTCSATALTAVLGALELRLIDPL